MNLEKPVHNKKYFSILLFCFCFFCVFSNGQKESTSEKRANVLSNLSSSDVNNKKTRRNENSNVSVVTVQKAQNTESKKDSETGVDYIVFTGDVYLTIERNDIRVGIWANKINYDRSRGVLYANDDVIMQEIANDASKRTLKGSSLVMNVNTFEGVFDDTKLTQIELKSKNTSESVMIISSDVFARSDSGVVAFKNGTVTFCDDEDPHWKIKASRVWLLPHNEFSFANAVLYIGKIPIMYLPFFYYPKDEMIFNPVFGYRPRVGYYTQTTTYLIGRKPLSAYGDSTDSVYNLSRPTQLMEQRREGLFLRNLDTPVAPENISSDYLKIMADAYSNLGFMGGIDGSFSPKDNFLTKIDFSAMLGLSRNLYETEKDLLFSPFNLEQKSEWNKTNVFGVTLPFRFGGNVALSGGKNGFNFNFSMPFYSDPFFKADFGNREESMDWLNYFTQGNVSSVAESEKANENQVDGFTWKISGSYKPEALNKSPLFNFSVTSFSSYIDWASKYDLSYDNKSVDPSRKFYYPSKIVPLDLRFAFSGVLYEYSTDESTDYSKILGEEAKSIALTSEEESILKDLENPLMVQNEFDNSENENQETTQAQSDSFYDEIAQEALPVLNIPAFKRKKITDFAYKLSYSYNPYFTSLFTYSSESWKTASDKAWNDYMSNFFLVAGKSSLLSDATWKNGFFSMKNELIFDHMFQKHPSVSSKYYTTASQRDLIHLSDLKTRKNDLITKNEFSLKPFVLFDVFKDTEIFYKNEIKLVRAQFSDGAVDTKLIGWNDQAFVTNQVGAVFSAKADDFGQTLKVSYNLPPLLPKYAAEMILDFPYISAKVETGWTVKSKDDETWYMLPITETIGAAFFDEKLKFTQRYRYSPEKKSSESFIFSAAFAGLSATYTALHTNGYTYQNNYGWYSDGEHKFRAFQLAIKYDMIKKDYFFWKNRFKFSPTLSTSIVFNFLRPTESYFTFDPGFELSLDKVFSFKFSSTHRNNVIYRYVQDGLPYSVKISGETNPLVDLAKSFAFNDEESRKASGFKMHGIKMELNHDLHDWTLRSVFEIDPTLVYENGSSYYDYTPYFSLSVVWKPMSGVKAKIVDDKGKVELNP